MSTATVNPIAASIAAAVNGVPTTMSLAEQLAAVQAENAKLKGLPVPTAAVPQVVATKPASVPVTPGGNAKSDAFLLSTVTKFKSAKRADGKPSGAFAVKVHGYLHAAGIPEPKIREAVAGAVLRNVISKMGIATKNGTMILYFDAKERPNSDNALLTPTEKAAAATAFGF